MDMECPAVTRQGQGEGNRKADLFFGVLSWLVVLLHPLFLQAVCCAPCRVSVDENHQEESAPVTAAGALTHINDC